MQGAVESIVDGLFSALVTLGTVPIIKCPKVWQALSAMCELVLFWLFLHSSKLQLHAYHKEPGMGTSHGVTNTAVPQSA